MPAVTELVISELLWLNYSSRDKPVYLYVNSVGSQTPDNEVSLLLCHIVSLRIVSLRQEEAEKERYGIFTLNTHGFWLVQWLKKPFWKQIEYLHLLLT